MNEYNALKDAIRAAIKPNGEYALTAQVLQNILIAIVNSFGKGYQFMGIATADTEPGEPDEKEFYVGFAGEYANFVSETVTVPVGGVVIFLYDTEWHANVVKVAERVAVSGNHLTIDEQRSILEQDIVNVNTLASQGEAFLTAAAARAAVSAESGLRIGGQVITYLVETDEEHHAAWVVDQYTGDDAEGWENDDNWQPFLYVELAKIISNQAQINEVILEALGNRYTKEQVDGMIEPLSERMGAAEEGLAAEILRAQAAESRLQDIYEGLTQNPIIVGPLPSSGQADTIYRVPGTSSYSDYMWNGTQFELMATYSDGRLDFINVNLLNATGSTPHAAYATADAARADISAASGLRALGLQITYLLTDGVWYTDQYIGTDISGWSTASNWKTLGPVSATQNASTGGYNLNIGSGSINIASQGEMRGFGYYVCDSAAGFSPKIVDALGYSLMNGGLLRVKFTNANTSLNTGMNVNSTGVKALLYNGARVSNNNSWKAGEIVEFIYDSSADNGNGGFIGRSAEVDTSAISGGSKPVISNVAYNNLSVCAILGCKPLNVNWISRLLKNDGTTGSMAGYHHSDFIPVTAGKWYYYAGSKVSLSFTSLAGYSSPSESDFVQVLDNSRAVNDGSLMEVVIPSGITHVRVGFIDSVSSFAGIWEYESNSVIGRELWTLRNEVEQKANILYNSNIINPNTVTSGKRLKPDGTLGTLDNSYVSDYIPVIKDQTIKIFNTHPSSSVIIAFAAYDIDKNFVRGVASNVDNYTQQGNEAYVRICMPSPTDAYPTLFANFGSILLPYAPYLTTKDAIDANSNVIKGKLDKVYSDNLIDMSKVALSYYINIGNGKIQPLSPTNNKYFVSDFIPVNGKNIYTNAYNGISAAIGCWVAYAEDKETVTRYSTTNGDINYVYQAGDYYVRFCFYKNDFTDVGSSYIGAFASYDELKPYIPYSEYLPLELLSEKLDARVPEKQSVTPVEPDYVYSICDDVENNSLALYADHFVDLPRASHKVLFKSSGSDKRDIFAPVTSVSASTEELNGGVNKKETAISDVIVGDYADANIALVHRSILNTYTANSKIRVLCIGDSVTDGTGSNYPKEITNNSKYTYWRLMQMFCLRDKKNHNNTGYDFLSIGKQSSVTYTYDNVQHKVYAEGRGGWSINNYLHDAQVGSVVNLFYDADKVWSGDYATELNSAGVKFSLTSYLAKYKTLADDGVTRLVVGDTAGTEITDINECDVCTPNVIVLQLSHNNGGNVNFYEEDMPLLIKAIKNEYPNIPIILSAIDETGCYNTQLYPMVSAIDAIYASLHTQIVKVAGIIKSLVADFENVWQCPNNFIQPTALSMTTRPVNRAESLVAENDLFKFGAEIGMGPNFHPNAYANAAWAYEMLACIKWVLSSQS